MAALDINLGVLLLLIVLALVFDFMNGFHDAANSIATVVSTRVLKPYQAVIWASIFNVVAIFVFQLKVAPPSARAPLIQPSSIITWCLAP